ncbi:MAG: GTP 3',8-cyclase MoaA [Terriglobia bacterium]
MIKDLYQREIKDLRVSVTDRCNLRCTYCMPLEKYAWIQKEEILSFEETSRLVTLFLQLGVDQVRLTGGEPLVRQDLEILVRQLSGLEGLKDLSLTTNGIYLSEKAEALATAGLRRLNVSLDSLNPERYHLMTQRGDVKKVIDGLFIVRRLGFHPIKINMVVERGTNDMDLLDMAEFCRENEFSLRFIEYMDVGNTNHWGSEKMVSKQEILERIHSRYPLIEVGRNRGTAPAVEYRYADGKADIGVIASVTEPFCSSCTRARITADGKLVTCLFSETGHDLKRLLRSGASDQELLASIRSVWEHRSDRYSDERLRAMNSPKGYDPSERKKIEMISLGG